MVQAMVSALLNLKTEIRTDQVQVFRPISYYGHQPASTISSDTQTNESFGNDLL